MAIFFRQAVSRPDGRDRHRSVYCALPLLAAISAVTASGLEARDEIGDVDTRFRLFSPDDSIRILAFDDPKVEGIACYLSRARKGGYSGALGLAEDTSDASIDCRRTGKVRFREKFRNGESVFSERRSLIFKQLRVVRFCDPDRNVLVYMAYSERVIEGSPNNSVSAVPLNDPAGDQGPNCASFSS